MFELIMAMDNNGGIGYKNYIPWTCKEELNLFKEKTLGKIVVCGTNTFKTLPELVNRTVIQLSRTKPQREDIISSLDELVIMDDIFIIGGAHVYEHTILNYLSNISVFHLSIMKKNATHVDTYFNTDLFRYFTISTCKEYNDFIHYELIPQEHPEQQYLDILRTILKHGDETEGRNGKTISLFKQDMKFDLRDGFPLLTTKKMFTRGIIEELLFFLRGDTDTTILKEKNVNIWNGNTNREFLDSLGMYNRREGVMGPMYGYQWRHYNSPYDEEGACPKEKGIDQLSYVIHLINTQPNSRRILMTAFNPVQLFEGVLPPCHSVILQFFVKNDSLDMFAYSRSADMFLGVPFNIASYALYLSIIAKITNKTPRFLHITLGDSHIYSEHTEQVKTQISRVPYKFPTLDISDNLKTIEDIKSLSIDDFIISNYKSHKIIKGKFIS
jgi:thymidylate synthase/dihydrofolate reductase